MTALPTQIDREAETALGRLQRLVEGEGLATVYVLPRRALDPLRADLRLIIALLFRCEEGVSVAESAAGVASQLSAGETACQSEGEPVAWRWRPKADPGCPWTVGTYDPDWIGDRWTVEPLYTAPRQSEGGAS